MDLIVIVLIALAVIFGVRIYLVGWEKAQLEVAGVIAAIGAAFAKFMGLFS